MIGNGDLAGENSSIRFVNGILGIVYLSDFNNILISDEHEKILLVQTAYLIRGLDVPSAG